MTKEQNSWLNVGALLLLTLLACFVACILMFNSEVSLEQYSKVGQYRNPYPKAAVCVALEDGKLTVWEYHKLKTIRKRKRINARVERIKRNCK